MVITLGWGRTVGGGNAADTLQQAVLPVAGHSACNRVNGRLVAVDERSMVCAGGQGKGGCQVTRNNGSRSITIRNVQMTNLYAPTHGYDMFHYFW